VSRKGHASPPLGCRPYFVKTYLVLCETEQYRMRKAQKHTQESIKKLRDGAQKSLASRRASGKIRALETPENRLKNTIIWLARFGGRSTKKLLIKNGATSNDFAVWSKFGIIEYEQRQFKITHKAEYQLISIVKLSKKGWRKAKEYDHPRENVYFQESHFSHDLIVQAYFLDLMGNLSSGYRVERFMTGEEIAGKAWKKDVFGLYHWGENTVSKYDYFDRQKNSYVAKSFKYDGLVLISQPNLEDEFETPQDDQIYIIELERNRKKESELEHFEVKFNTALEYDGRGFLKTMIILVQNQLAQSLWKEKVKTWENFANNVIVIEINAEYLLGNEKKWR